MKFPISPWIAIMAICVFVMAISFIYAPLANLFWFMFWLFVAIVCIWAIKRIFFPGQKE
jgi:phosphatidylserine synthase